VSLSAGTKAAFMISSDEHLAGMQLHSHPLLLIPLLLPPAPDASSFSYPCSLLLLLLLLLSLLLLLFQALFMCTHTCTRSNDYDNDVAETAAAQQAASSTAEQLCEHIGTFNNALYIYSGGQHDINKQKYSLRSKHV